VRSVITITLYKYNQYVEFGLRRKENAWRGEVTTFAFIVRNMVMRTLA
jgi:hypothetical protein